MLRLLLPAAVALLLLPAASAQLGGATITVAGLEAGTTADGRTAVIPLQVTLETGRLVCIGATSAATATVALTASIASDVAGANASLTPAQLTFTLPAQALSGHRETREVALLVSMPRGLAQDVAANVTVGASLAGATGCQPGLEAAPVTASGAVAFESDVRAISGGTEPQMPGFGLVAALAALAAVAVALRRRA